MLAWCQVVNDAGEGCKKILLPWLRANKIHYRTGYLGTSNVFSANLYVLVESGKIEPDVAARIDNWLTTEVTSTFSVVFGTSWPLDEPAARCSFAEAIAAKEVSTV